MTSLPEPLKRSSPKRRSSNTGPNSTTAQLRKELYRQLLARVDGANRAGYHLEAIAMLESLLADRLESRLASKNPCNPAKHGFSELANLCEELSGAKSSESSEIKSICQEIRAWAVDRNVAVHELAKVQDGRHGTWKDKERHLKLATREGKRLFRSLDKELRRVAKAERSAKVKELED